MSESDKRNVYAQYDGRQNFQNMLAHRMEQLYIAHVRDDDRLFSKTIEYLKSAINNILNDEEKKSIAEAKKTYNRLRRDLQHGRYVGVVGQHYKRNKQEELNDARTNYFELLTDAMHNHKMLLPNYEHIEGEFDIMSALSEGGL